MAYNPYPFVVTESGGTENAPDVAQPIALYGGVDLPISSENVELEGLEGTAGGYNGSTVTHVVSELYDAYFHALSEVGNLASRVEALESDTTPE